LFARAIALTNVTAHVLGGPAGSAHVPVSMRDHLRLRPARQRRLPGQGARAGSAPVSRPGVFPLGRAGRDGRRAPARRSLSRSASRRDRAQRSDG